MSDDDSNATDSTERPDPSDEPQHDNADGQTGGRREEAYRRRALAAEASRDVLQGRIDALHRQQAEALAAGRGLAVGADVFSVGGASLDDLRTEDGDLDLDRINALADDMLASRPGLRVKIHNGDQGMRGLQTRSRPAATWGDVLAGRD